jgi:uncharacterized protein YqhQ
VTLHNFEHKKLPNATAVLVLGILSICFCAAWGLPGLAMGIIALALYRKDKAVYDSDPQAYEQSFKNSSAGKICAIVGISLSAFMLLFLIIYFIILGSFFGAFFGLMNEAAKHNQNHRYEDYDDYYYEDELESDSSNTYVIEENIDSLSIEE